MSTVYVNLNCEKCGELYSIRRDSYYHRKSKGRPNLCDKCRKIKHQEDMSEWHKNLTTEEKQRRYDNFSVKWKENWQTKSQEEKDKLLNHLQEGRDNYYANLTDEERERENERRRMVTRNMWSECSPEEKERRIKLLHEGKRRYYESLSDEEKQVVIQKLCNGFKVWRENMSREERIKESEERRAIWLAMSEEEKKKALDMLHNSWQRWYSNLNEEDKRKKIEKFKDFWNDMTIEKFEQWAWNQAEGNSNFYKSMNIPLNSNDALFADDLDRLNIKYEWQYHNQTVYPGFYELFPENIGINGMRVSPYHSWDFLVKTKQKDILVDVDGSIHNMRKGLSLAKGGYDVGAKIQFNDSQRPYQTDGLDAYVIKAIHDKIKDDTKVIRLIPGSKNVNYMTYKEFLNILQFMNIIEIEI